MYIDRESVSFKDTKENNYMMTRVKNFLSSIFSKMKSFNKVKAVTTVMILFATSGLAFSGCSTKTVDTKPDTSSSEATSTPDSSVVPEPTDTPTDTPTDVPTDATVPTEEPTEEPTEAQTETQAQQVVQAPTEAPAQSSGCTPTYVAEQGHYVTVVDTPASTAYVIDTQAYDEPTYDYRGVGYQANDGTIFLDSTYGSPNAAGEACGDYCVTHHVTYHTYTILVQTGTVHHDAVGHNVTVPAVTHQEYVVDVPAHTEGC